MNNIYYIYMYLREDCTPYYIGKGSGNRAFSKKQNEIKPNHDKSNIRFIIENISEDEAFMWEEFWIDFFGRKDLGTGCLRNKTHGGQGPSGAVRSTETKKKLSQGNKLRPITEEHKANMSNALKGKYIKDNHWNYGRTLTRNPNKKNPDPITCPHCNKTSSGNVMFRFHFDNCKLRP